MLIAFTIVICSVSAQQSELNVMEQDVQETVTEVAAMPSPSLLAYPQLDGLSAGTVLSDPYPIYYERPSFYLQQAAKRFTTGIITQIVGGVVGGTMIGSNDASIVGLGALILVSSELTGFIVECCGISSLRKAGMALEKVHIESNGVAIDL